MQNQVSEIQSSNSSEPRHQIFWDDFNNPTTTQLNESYFNKFKRLIPKHHLKPSDFMKPCSDGKTILENIAEKGHSDIIEQLFESYDDIDIDKKYNEGNTLLHIAVKNGNSQMAEFLIKKGARIEILSDGDQIPLTLCPPENTEIIKLLQDTQKLDRDLHEAIKSQNKERIRELLKSGARPNGGITQEVEEQTVSQGKVRKGKFVSNIRLAIESDSTESDSTESVTKEIIDLLMAGCVKTTSNPLEIACSSNKKKIFEYLVEYLSRDGAVSFEKNIPNLLNKSIQHGSVDMVKYLLNDYDINYKYENEFNNNALQVAISNQFHFKTDDEKARGKEIINLLIDKIIEKYPQHEEALSSKNTNGYDARFMLSHAGEIGKELLDIINKKIEREKQKEDDRMAKQKEYEYRTQKRIQELEEGRSVSNPGCMTALCCCMNVNVERLDVVGNSQGVKADIVFEEKKLATPAEEAKTLQGETPKDQQPNTKPIEVQAPSNINSMQKTNFEVVKVDLLFKTTTPQEEVKSSNINSMQKISEESQFRSDSPRDNTNSVGITLTSTPAVTPSKPSQGGGMPKPMEASSTLA